MAPEQTAPSSARPRELVLPEAVSNLGLVRQLLRELEAVDEFMRQNAIREPGKQEVLPRVGKLLESLADANGFQLLQGEHRAQLKAFLQSLETTAPTVHISFAVEATIAVITRMVQWMRANVHPHVLVEIGMQPTIVAGCVVRTTNKVFDFSLQKQFDQSQDLLVQSLEETMKPVAGSVINAAAAAAALPEPKEEVVK